MKSSKVTNGDIDSPKTQSKLKRKRTQTAEGWRRSVRKICEKRGSKKD